MPSASSGQSFFMRPYPPGRVSTRLALTKPGLAVRSMLADSMVTECACCRLPRQTISLSNSACSRRTRMPFSPLCVWPVSEEPRPHSRAAVDEHDQRLACRAAARCTHAQRKHFTADAAHPARSPSFFATRSALPLTALERRECEDVDRDRKHCDTAARDEHPLARLNE